MTRGPWILLLMLCSLALLPAKDAYAVERFAVLIGANGGDAHEPNLRFAEADAERMYEVLKDVGGFRPENMLLLRSESAQAVQRAIIAMNDRIRALNHVANTQTVLLVYYSGHGDAHWLHLNRTTLELSMLEQLVRSSAAAFRILMVDACRSGTLTRVKGGTPAPPFTIRLGDTINGEGVVFLTASSANEDAQESDALGGSFFTHYFRSGLLGPADENRDGRVTLEEAYRYTYANTMRASSQTIVGTQHPTFHYDLRGQGNIVLSEPSVQRGNRATLFFPAQRSYLVFSGDANGRVVGEVGARDVNRTLSVAEGSYFIRGRGSSHLLEGTIIANRGQSVEVADALLDRIDYARLVRKGGEYRGFASGIQAGYSVRSALENEAALCHGGFIGYSVVLPALTVSPRIEACRGSFRNERLSATVDSLGLVLRATHAWDFARWFVELGAEAGGTLHQQRFETKGRAPTRDTFGGNFGLGVGVGAILGQGFTLFAESGFESHLFHLQHTQSGERALEASFALRQRFGVGKIW